MIHRCVFLFRALDSSLWILGFFPGLVLALFLIGIFRVAHEFRSLCRWKCWLIDIARNPPSPTAPQIFLGRKGFIAAHKPSTSLLQQSRKPRKPQIDAVPPWMLEPCVAFRV
jgi:hypothetical protein